MVLSLSVWFKVLKFALFLGKPALKPAAAWEAQCFLPASGLGRKNSGEISRAKVVAINPTNQNFKSFRKNSLCIISLVTSTHNVLPAEG